MNHKYRKPKQNRSGCLLCKGHKINAHVTAKRRKDKARALAHERAAW